MKQIRQFESFFVYVTTLNSLVKTKGRVIKRKIGDSVTNNRTLTVNQLVRFLQKIGERKAALELKAVKNTLASEIKKRRKNRSDSIDITELVDTYREVVMNKKQLRRTIGKTLGGLNG